MALAYQCPDCRAVDCQPARGWLGLLARLFLLVPVRCVRCRRRFLRLAI